MEQSCTVGVASGSAKDCHKLTFSKHRGLLKLSDLPKDDQQLIRLRSGLEDTQAGDVCYYHRFLFLDKYESFQKVCSDPFNSHKKRVKLNLRVVSVELAKTLSVMCLEKNIKPGQKLCINCTKKCNSSEVNVPTLAYYSSGTDIGGSCSVGNDAGADMIDVEIERMNTSAAALECSPVKIKRLKQRGNVPYAKQKVQQLQGKIASTMTLIQSSSSAATPVSNVCPPVNCSSCDDCAILMSKVKHKLSQCSSNAEKIQLLTIIPHSLTRKEAAEQFDVSEYSVRKARHMENLHGILSKPKYMSGKTLSEEVVARVREFYESDEFSRMCPGIKDCVTIRDSGKKERVQKRLLLCNLNELHTAYKDRYGNEIGFSKFCELRPRWCVNVNSAGSHNTCVCILHQNVKLMVQAASLPDDYKQLIALCVCGISNMECMLHRCEHCPGSPALENYLNRQLKDLIESDEAIVCKQWVQQDRTSLITREFVAGDFVSTLLTRIDKLTEHHFISKHQNNYLRILKESLKVGEIIVLLDFAENFTFIVQDAVQGYYWENTQVTLHPFVVYWRKEDGSLGVLNLCMISDYLTHETAAVYTFIRRMLSIVKEHPVHFSHVHYFSDGAVSQYKNFKNLCNLCCHAVDFGPSAEWNFFASYHGKSPCDGIAGTTKRLARRASLQRTVDRQILNIHDFYQFCMDNITGIQFTFVTSHEIERSKKFLQCRFENARTVPGTRDNHYFLPCDKGMLKVSRVSADTSFFVAQVDKGSDSTTLLNTNVQPGQYICCVYDSKWWLGNVMETSDEHEDLRVQFMHPHGPNRTFHWPASIDDCWVPNIHVLCVVSALNATTTGRRYLLPEPVFREVEMCHRKFLEQNNLAA